MLVVCSQSFGMVGRTVAPDLRLCHRRKVDLSVIHVLDLYRVIKAKYPDTMGTYHYQKCQYQKLHH